ncbi:MarR family winged helix-turn-helix transcriptional regulator [Rathayibacter soli]|uniref:MarR family winged helix-turn-helix transcriptional regulator n=1 Tax=Rathayibacter soli TaxID=3144168 RepID=UPI0027E4B36E|nr:MarR family transcriptional regulator [Glaciibacter superstes]
MLTEPITLPTRGSSDEPEDLHRVLSDLVQVAARLTRLARRATNNPESIATWRTLSVLQESGPMRLGELAECSQVAQPTMTKIVGGLVERDWIKRIADSDDARAWQLALSSKGLAALREWRSGVASALLPRFADVDDEQARIIRQAIELVRPRVTQSHTHPAHNNESIR